MSEARHTSNSEDLGWALGVLLRTYHETVAPPLRDFPHGARGYQTLCEVVRGEQPSQLALANRLGIDRTVMTYLIDDLVAAGLVQRQANPTDRRQRQIVATPEGRAALAGLCAQVVDAESTMLGALDEDERRLLRRLLAKAAGGRAGLAGSVDPCEVVSDPLPG